MSSSSGTIGRGRRRPSLIHLPSTIGVMRSGAVKLDDGEERGWFPAMLEPGERLPLNSSDRRGTTSMGTRDEPAVE